MPPKKRKLSDEDVMLNVKQTFLDLLGTDAVLIRFFRHLYEKKNRVNDMPDAKELKVWYGHAAHPNTTGDYLCYQWHTRDPDDGGHWRSYKGNDGLRLPKTKKGGKAPPLGNLLDPYEQGWQGGAGNCMCQTFALLLHVSDKFFKPDLGHDEYARLAMLEWVEFFHYVLRTTVTLKNFNNQPGCMKVREAFRYAQEISQNEVFRNWFINGADTS